MKQVEAAEADFLMFEKLGGLSGLRHGISLRQRGKQLTDKSEDKEEFDFSLRDPERARGNVEQFCKVLGLPTELVVRPRQVHGSKVAVVKKPGQVVGQADAVCTNIKQAPLMLAGADCPLLLVYEPTTAALGMAHAGRRGTVQMIAARLVERMREEFGSEPSRMTAGIGPGICPKCYEVGEEVVVEFRKQFVNTSGVIIENCRRDADDTNGGPRTHHENGCGANRDSTQMNILPPHFMRGASETNKRGGAKAASTRWYLDLSRANQEQLIAAGVPAGNIEESGCCTFEQAQWFYSYRREGERTGRHALLAGLM